MKSTVYLFTLVTEGKVGAPPNGNRDLTSKLYRRTCSLSRFQQTFASTNSDDDPRGPRVNSPLGPGSMVKLNTTKESGKSPSPKEPGRAQSLCCLGRTDANTTTMRLKRDVPYPKLLQRIATPTHKNSLLNTSTLNWPAPTPLTPIEL